MLTEIESKVERHYANIKRCYECIVNIQLECETMLVKAEQEKDKIYNLNKNNKGLVRRFSDFLIKR